MLLMDFRYQSDPTLESQVFSCVKEQPQQCAEVMVVYLTLWVTAQMRPITPASLHFQYFPF